MAMVLACRARLAHSLGCPDSRLHTDMHAFGSDVAPPGKKNSKILSVFLPGAAMEAHSLARKFFMKRTFLVVITWGPRLGREWRRPGAAAGPH